MNSVLFAGNLFNKITRRRHALSQRRARCRRWMRYRPGWRAPKGRRTQFERAEMCFKNHFIKGGVNEQFPAAARFLYTCAAAGQRMRPYIMQGIIDAHHPATSTAAAVLMLQCRH